MAHGAAVWLPFIQPFGTVLLGVGAFVIAFRQMRIANYKIRLDAFDRRSASFFEAMSLLDEAKEETIDIEEITKKLTANYRLSRLLFNEEYTVALDKCIDSLQSGKSLRGTGYGKAAADVFGISILHHQDFMFSKVIAYCNLSKIV